MLKGGEGNLLWNPREALHSYQEAVEKCLSAGIIRTNGPLEQALKDVKIYVYSNHNSATGFEQVKPSKPQCSHL